MSSPTPTIDTPPTPLAAGDRVAVVAGSGRLPVDVVEGLVALGHRPIVLPVIGDADATFDEKSVDVMPLSLGAFARAFDEVKRRGVTHLILSGGIGRRPRLSEIRPTLSLLRHLPRMVSALSRGDNGLLSLLVSGIEHEGIKVVGAQDIVRSLLAESGALTREKPRSADAADLRVAFDAAKTLGALDIGQAAVAIGGRVIAVEGIEGTDGLLGRVAGLRGHGRLAGRTRGVLVKCAKPGQELRADLPTIGPATVDAVHAAGLAGIGVETERAIVLERAETVRRADALGLFVVGLDAGEA